ncbi:copper resistance protein CopC [Nitrosococcus halophilus Nc 4]|uniref:Copper resistance protein CopC n=1 Tax=Nitrosococcus halophilus (strain Nc4) TaxID=472759 RepID=D5C077_NITHN|nr:copper resistance CopC family protein [Nitrosococcus halophilus]ADE14403.1 copper resistance protein CopC [Nitrosococcus halophilus Nc 4]
MPPLTWGLAFKFWVLWVLGAVMTLAWGHAVIVKSSPADQEVLARAPEAIMLRFNVKIEKAFAQASLWGAKDRPRRLSIPESNFAPEADPARLYIPLPSLAPGPYQVRYKILATDGHTTEGVIRFVISEPQ